MCRNRAPRRPLVCRMAALVGLLFFQAQYASAMQGDGVMFESSLAGLRTASGETLRKDSFSGKSMLVLFGFASCADVCPLTLLAVRHAMRELGDRSSDVVPIFISVDPERDSPRRLDEYVKAFDKRILGVTGNADELRRVARRYGVFFEKRWVDPSTGSYVYDHTATIMVISREGKLLKSVSTAAAPERVAVDLVAALTSAR